VAQADEGQAAGFVYLSRFHQSGGKCARSLYRPVALFALGGSAAGMGVATTFRSADTQTEAAPGDRRPSAGRQR
jgi:hypothetical protein